MRSGLTLWEEMQQRYQEGVAFVEQMLQTWQELQPQIDSERYQHVLDRLVLQLANACEWRDECIRYFGQFAEHKTN